MTIENLSSAIKLNNNYLIAETNKLIDWINGELNEVLLNHVQNIDNIYDLLVQLKTIEKADTNKLTNILNKVNSDTNQRITDLNDASEKHFKDITIHVTQDDKDNWNQKIGTNATDLKKHIEDTAAHTTQAEKDAWTNSIANNKKSLENHISDTVSHVTQTEKDTWTNGIKDNKNNLANHVSNTVIHVTKEDKDLWNATLGNAKAYAKSLFDQLTSFEIVKCTQLPTENIKTMTIYFLQIDPEQDDLYEEYMYIDGQWEKIGNTRIDLSDYVTKAMLQSEVDTLNNTINTKETAINQAISNLENKHDQDVQDLQKDVSDLSNTVTQLDTDINKTITDKAKELQDNIDTLENKHDQDVQDINDAIDQLGQDINDEIDQLEQNVNNELDQLGQDIDNINTNISNLHTHSNKSVLDNLTQSVIDNSHTHANKSVLDNVTQQIIDDSHKHTNKSALDNLTQTVIDNSHKHTNQSVIDKFSTDNDGKLLYNNNELIETFTESDVTKLINYLWPSEYKTNFIMADNTYIVTQDNKIFVAKEGDS